jgi:hypothetical protein
MQDSCNLPVGLKPWVSPELTSVNWGLVIAQAMYHCSQAICHGDAYPFHVAVFHLPHHLLSWFIFHWALLVSLLLPSILLHLLMVITLTITWHLLFLFPFWNHLLWVFLIL